jgi:hypothetical protein
MTGPTTPDPVGPPPPPRPPQRPAATQPSPQIPDPSPGEPRPPVGPSRFTYRVDIPNPFAHRPPVATAVLGLYGWSVVWRDQPGGPLRQRVHPDPVRAYEHMHALAAHRVEVTA